MRRNLGSDDTTVNVVVDNNANTIENTYVEAMMRGDTLPAPADPANPWHAFMAR